MAKQMGTRHDIIGVDNQATILATEKRRPPSGQYPVTQLQESIIGSTADQTARNPPVNTLQELRKQRL